MERREGEGLGAGARWTAIISLISIAVVASCGFDDVSEPERATEGIAAARPEESPARAQPAAGLLAAANPIASENSLTGTSAWRLGSTASGSQLEGYASVTSVQHGESVAVHVRADVNTSVGWELYRMGYYGGQLGRLIASGGPVAVGPQPKPSPSSSTGLVECRWPVSFSVQTDPSWTSGFHLIKLTRSDGRQRYVPIVIRADERKGIALVQLSVTTWQAYNDWGGESLYNDALGLPGGHAYQVSFNRPYADGNGAGEYFWFEHFFHAWAESNGYDLGYVTNVDVDRDPSLLDGQRLFLSVGHDEYWSFNERNNVQAALDKGVNLAFFSADSVLWQIRLEPGADGAARRTEVCYKGQASASDPLGSTAQSTVQFRDPPVSRPENALLGVMSEAWELVDLPWVVRGSDSWVYEGTGVVDGDSIPLIVGYESDKVFDNGRSPAGLSILAASPVLDSDGRPTWHNATVYTAASGAFVLAAGAHRWSLGLSYPGRADARVQRATANIFARAGLLPALTGSDFGAGEPRSADFSAAAAGVATFAGASGQEGLVEGPSAGARFRRPAGVAADAVGNIYVADTGNHVIRKIANDAQRTVTTIAGTGAPGLGEGAGLEAALNAPQGITIGSGGALFVADTRNNRIVRVAPDPPYTVSTWAGSGTGRSGKTDGNGTSARFFFPMAIAAVGSDVYVADTRNSRIRRVDSGRNVTTVVGSAGSGLSDGSGSSARMKWPTAIAVAGGTLYVVDTGNRRIRSVALDGAYTTRTLAGSSIGGFADGAASSSLLMPWGGIAVSGGDVFVADTGNSRIRLLRAGRVTTYAGDGRAASRDGAGPVASFSVPMGLAKLPDGTLVVVSEGSSTIAVVGAGVGGGGSDAGPAPDAGPTPDAGPAPDAGAPDGGAPDAGAPDGGAPDAGAGGGVLVRFGDLWNYDDRNIDPGPSWTSAAFDDSAWRSGPGQLGYGDGDEATVLSQTTPAQPSVYFRKKFDVETPADATLSVVYDDGLIVYLNGASVLSRNVSDAAFGAYATATSSDNSRASAVVPAARFLPGENVLAVLVKQSSGTSSDVSFDLELVTNANAPAPTLAIEHGELWKYDDSNVDPGAGWILAAYDDSAWKSGPSQLGYGDGDEATTLAHANPAQPTVYFRKKVALAKAISAAKAEVIHDDGVVVWVNGRQVFSRFVGSTAHTAYATSTSTDNQLSTFAIDPAAFTAGENIITVAVKQGNGTSSDVSFDFKLELMPAP